MSPEVAALFRVLVDLPPEARASYFADHDVEPHTRREVEELLAHDSTDGDRLSMIVGTASRSLLQAAAVGMRCGAFRLVSEIGCGGMGVVYLAERVDGEVMQRAAVKLMQPGWNEIQRERFLQERTILAALTHPNIAHLLDAGHLDDGQPYLAMEYVAGRPIHEYCEDLGTRQKIELFIKVCKAVAYLHANSVLHRDLKPGNILVPDIGEPKLLDFGIAKILDLRSDSTVTQMRMHTPDYASPEQLAGGPIGIATDIYSLGAVLYRLLTGRPPRGMHQETWPGELKGDLGRVLKAAVNREPGERYATVEEFASDLQAYLDSRPVRASRGGWLYQAGKFVRRHSLSVAVTGFLAVALIAVGGFAWSKLRSDSAVPQFTPKRLTANTTELPVQSAAISPDGKSIAYSDPLGIHLHDIASSSTRLVPQTAGHMLVQWTPDGSGLLTEFYDPAGGTTGWTVSLTGSKSSATPAADWHKDSPDRTHRANLSANGQRLVLQDDRGGHQRELWSSAERAIWGFEWSPNSRQVAVRTSGQGSYSLETIDITTGRKETLIPAADKLAISSFVWPAQNRIIVTIDEKPPGVNSVGGANLWDIALDNQGRREPGGLRKLTAWSDFPIRPGSLTTDGKRLVFVRSFRQRDVYVAAMEADRSRIETPRRFTLDLGDDYPTAWTRDSKKIIFTSDRNGPSAIFLQDLNKQTADQLVTGPSSQIIPRVAPDGKWILFYGRNQGKRGIMRVPINGGLPEMILEAERIADFRCSRAGPCIVSERQGPDMVVFELDPVRGKDREIYRLTTTAWATPDVSPDGKWLATALSSKVILRSFQTGAVVREITIRGVESVPNLITLDYAPDGKGFFAGDSAPTSARLLHIDLTGKASVLWRQAGSPSIWGVPSPDGKYLALMMRTEDSNVYIVESF